MIIIIIIIINLYMNQEYLQYKHLEEPQASEK